MGKKEWSAEQTTNISNNSKNKTKTPIKL